MKHFGDITKINGYDLPPTDVITGGSPCQDLSIAGKRAGLDGERSGLFMEQIRIVKEMREYERSNGRSNEYIRPRYMVWENVPGAFSSNGGKDFQAVLTEIVRVVRQDAPNVPLPDRGGWKKSGCIMGYGTDGCPFSVAYRVHDAQFWGVPQRRKRIALVADFGGLSAPEICFERKGLSGNFEKVGEDGQNAAGPIKKSVGSAISFQERAGKPGGGKGILIQNERVGALSTLNNQSVYCLQGSGATSQRLRGNGYNEEVAYTLNTMDIHGVCVSDQICLNDQGGKIMEITKDKTATLRAESHGHLPIVCNDKNPAFCMNVGFFQAHEEKSAALLARDYKDPPIVSCQKTSGLLMASGYQKNGTQEAMSGMYIVDPVVRRMTPKECERLQGYPDGWTDIGEWIDTKGKKHKESDTPRYKALGNSIALPFWFWLLRRISAQYERPATLGSLFDGIGGFPLCWEKCNGKGTALWASEIEEFPIAVTKKRFPDENDIVGVM